jgi:putative aldouronate transport system permease protein
MNRSLRQPAQRPRWRVARALRRVRRHAQLLLFLAPALLYFAVFHLYPLYGLQLAFKDYRVTEGIWGSPWVGLAHFERLFSSYSFPALVRNTALLSLYQLALFPLPVVTALALHEVRHGALKRTAQTVLLAPHFISVVVLVGMLLSFLHPTTGVVNHLLRSLGGTPIAFMTEPGWFRTVWVLSGEWQGLGWGAIVYLAALASVDPQLHEAAVIDGASRLQRVWHINLPSLVPTLVVLLLLQLAGTMSVGFEKVYLMQNPLNLEVSEVLQTYVYKAGLLGAQIGFGTAVGLFNALVNLALLLGFNGLARRVAGVGLW